MNSSAKTFQTMMMEEGAEWVKNIHHTPFFCVSELSPFST